jgi:hypothetical protein
MTRATVPSPKTGKQLVDEYFIENRTRILEIAAFLDRLDRVGDGQAHGDYRMRAFRQCLEVLVSGGYPRMPRIQMILSDPRAEPLDIRDTQNASGAYDPEKEA